jgi:hypothetical protein
MVRMFLFNSEIVRRALDMWIAIAPDAGFARGTDECVRPYAARLRLRWTTDGGCPHILSLSLSAGGTKAGYPGRVFRIPASVLVHLGGEICPMSSRGLKPFFYGAVECGP